MPSLSVASWNINSVRARLDIVERFLKEAAPDILCLQETKAANDVFPAEFFRARGYPHQRLHGQRMHHGVAIVSRVPLTDAADDCWRYDWQDNGEARHVGVRLEAGFRLENVYVPAGGDVPDPAVNPKFAQKLAFLERMTGWAAALSEPTLLVGDLNIAPLESDVWSHKQLLDVVSHTPVEVAALARLQAAHGWVDLGRHFFPAPQRLYTWWSYRAQDWAASDRGRRLDHMWASPALAERAVAHRVHEEARAWVKPSDHVPLVTEFRW
jgi:exodeoxyribonuclease-3